MSKFTAYFEDTTVDGLLRQIWEYLDTHKGFGVAPGVMNSDQGGEDCMAGESSIGDDQSEGDG